MRLYEWLEQEHYSAIESMEAEKDSCADLVEDYEHLEEVAATCSDGHPDIRSGCWKRSIPACEPHECNGCKELKQCYTDDCAEKNCTLCEVPF